LPISLIRPTRLLPKSKKNELQIAARALRLRLIVLTAVDQSDFPAAFAAIEREQAGGLVVGGDLLFLNNVNQLVVLAARNRIPAIYARREYAAAGGLMGYGSDFPDMYRRAGVYVGRILDGEKPADLPVQQATKMELIINLKTARTLGITFPPTLLVRADEVIE
jgi:putative tryptophan/tyrosine transport system substrate-binding protein